jgi:hypothetical protein
MGKKQPKKRGWRKVNIEDVEEALEDERLIHKMKRKTGADDDDEADELFTVDTKGSYEGISKTSRRQLARAKIFPPKGPNIGMTSTEEAKIERAERGLEASKRPKPKAPEVYDLWGEEPASSQASGNLKAKGSRLLLPKPVNVKVPKTLHQKVGLAPAVIPAHEGQSMNPHKDAYEDLACMAAAAEIEREREAEDLDRKMRPMTYELRDWVGEEKLRDMSEEEKIRLYRSLHIKNAAEEAEEQDGALPSKRSKAWKQKKQSLRKEGRALKKEKQMSNEDSIKAQAQAQRLLESRVGQIPNLLRDMQEEDELHKNRREYREKIRTKRKQLEATTGVVPKKRKLGGGKFKEEAAVVPDAEAGTKGLRAMPLRASAVRERLSSVVRRGLLPPPAETSGKEYKHWVKKKSNKLKRGRKFMSPLLKDNLLLR